MSIIKGNPFVKGEVLSADALNELANTLIDAGYIDLPAVSSIEVDADTKAIAQASWVAYVDNDIVKFAEELPEGYSLLGIVTDNDTESNVITIMAPTDAVPGSNGGITPARYPWSAYLANAGKYATAVGSYDAEGNQLSTDPDFNGDNVAFTIKMDTASDKVQLGDEDPDFISSFGNANTLQRNLAMRKLGGFFAVDVCEQYNPIASKFNTRGLWQLPSISMLRKIRPIYDGIDPTFEAIQRKLIRLNGATPLQSLYNYWSCLEYDSMYSFYLNMNLGDVNNYYKGYDFNYVRPFLFL